MGEYTDAPSSLFSIGRHSGDYYKPFPPNYFAPKLGSQTLNIGIVGAGIAGLTAAVALVQSGHNVEVRRSRDSLQSHSQCGTDMRL